MSTCSAALAYDLLQCVAEEVRRIKLEPCSGMGMDDSLFEHYQDDESAHKFIEDFVSNRLWSFL